MDGETVFFNSSFHELSVVQAKYFIMDVELTRGGRHELKHFAILNRIATIDLEIKKKKKREIG